MITKKLPPVKEAGVLIISVNLCNLLQAFQIIRDNSCKLGAKLPQISLINTD